MTAVTTQAGDTYQQSVVFILWKNKKIKKLHFRINEHYFKITNCNMKVNKINHINDK